MKKALLCLLLSFSLLTNAQEFDFFNSDYTTTQKEVVNINFPDYVLPGNYSISGEFDNTRLAVKNVVINYSVDGGAVISKTIDFGTSQDYSFNINDIGYLTAGNHTVKAWVSEINGQTQSDVKLFESIVHVASKAVPRNGLIEQFTSSTCPPCASENKTLDPLLVKNNPNTGGRVNVVKYQMNWPSPGNDPSYNPHGVSRKNYYGVNGIPAKFINGKSGGISSQANIDATYSTTASASINATIGVTGNNIKCAATITPEVTVSGVKIHQVILQKQYTYSGASTTQKEYYFVTRKMSPDGNGETKNLTAGTPITVSFDHTAVIVTKPAQNSFDFWQTTNIEYQYVVFVQDNAKVVLNSGSGVATSTGIVSLKNDAKIGIYPNPSDEYAIIAFKTDKITDALLNIFDINGKVVYTNKASQLVIGQNEITIDTQKFAGGIYTVVVSTNEGVYKEKLSVVK